MPSQLQKLIATTPICDVHEHHMPDITLSQNVHLLQLFQQSYAGWTQARPYPLPGQTRAADPMLAVTPRTTWESLQPYLEQSGSNAFVRNLTAAVMELHGAGARDLTRSNWERIDASVRRRHRQHSWPSKVLHRARVARVITDPYADPLLDARLALGPHYRSVLRINAFACGWHPEAHDHNGNSARALLRRLHLAPRSFDDYLEALRVLVEGMPARGQVALKNALAYDRDLAFDAPDLRRARRAWNKRRPTPDERKAFSDVVVDRFCQLAATHDLPMQMHLGTAIIRGSHPLQAAGLIERHPGTRFLLMHLAYPWSRDLLGMAFVYRNIWIDLTWSMLLSPSHFKLALHEAIDVLPDDSRLMLGGDNWHVEETYGTLQLARRLLTEVFGERIRQRTLTVAQANRLAVRILRSNAEAFFRLHPQA